MKKAVRKSKKAQVTVFIILAIVIVAGIAIYFLLGGASASAVHPELESAYNYYISCIERSAVEGISLLGEQGGHIETPEFVPGSSYRPFSSQLDFFGQGVPYWMYVSGNNLLREQVPTKGEMEEELSQYVQERITECNFGDFEERGFAVLIDEGFVDVQINEQKVEVSVDADFTVINENRSAIVSTHELEIDSKLGKFYDLAIETYNYEKETAFLEAYALDAMRVYAPVSGVEIGCEPLVFNKQNISEELKQAFAANIGALKLAGDYYDLSSQEAKYFEVDIGRNIDENVNLLYSPNWPTRIEIYGDEVVGPIGLQEGLGVLGFCYVPYKFVYDINFPVMIQFYDEEEFFQFPVAVVIEKNFAREALPSAIGTSIESTVCQYKNSDLRVYTYDSELNPVEARITFKCLDSTCDLGETVNRNGEAFLETQAPQCVNGFVVASAEGYENAKFQISTNSEAVADLIMKKKYSVNLDLGDVDKALVYFESEDYTTSALYPDLESVELIDGFYNVTVYAYSDSLITIPAVDKRECVEVPSEGFGGVIGFTQEKCFDINLPATEVGFAIVGGGKTQEYIDEGRLRDSTEININVPLFGAPSSLEELSYNQALADSETIYINFE